MGTIAGVVNAEDIGQLAADLVEARFANAQAYGSAAYSTAVNYLSEMEILAGVGTLAPPSTSVTVDVQDTNLDYNVIEKPVSPDTSMTVYTAPNSPIIDDITIDATADIPSFDVPTLSLNLPEQPETRAVEDVGDPDPIGNIDLPTKPSYVLPALPTIREASIPDPPTLTMPTFEGEMPVDDLVCPTNTFQFQETPYASSLLDAAKTKLENDVKNGGTGLGADIEDAIWKRQLERDEQALQDARDKAADVWAASGFGLPDGVLTTMLQELEKQYLDTRMTTSRDISVKQAELALQNTQFSVQQAVALEGQLINYTGQIAQRQLEASKALIDASIAIFNAAVTKYNAKIEGYKAQAVVYESRIRGALAQAEIYKIQIEAAKLTLDMDNVLVELYKAQLAGVQSLIDCYKAEMQAAGVKADVEKLKLEAFRSKVEAYTAKVNLNVAEFNMYDSAIRGEATKAQIYGTQVDAFKSRVEAAKIDSDIKIEKARVSSELQKLKAAIYESDISAFKSKVEAEKTRIDGIVSVYQGDIEAYKSETMAESSRIESIVKAFSAKVEQATRVADIYIKQVEIALKAYTEQLAIKAELIKAGAGVATQLAASSLASVNASAAISEEDGKRLSSSSTSTNETSNRVSKSDDTSNRTSWNYNYSF